MWKNSFQGLKGLSMHIQWDSLANITANYKQTARDNWMLYPHGEIELTPDLHDF